MKETTKKWAILGVLSMFLASQCSLILNPALASFAEKYSDIPYSTVLMLSTINSLLVAPASLISGAIAGTRLKYRPLCLLAIALIVIGGVLPYFNENFYFALACRAVTGVGVGLATPLGNALAMCLYEGDRASHVQGIGTTFMNICGIAIQNIVGIVCVINLQYTWLMHAFMILPFIIVLLFLPEPEIATKTVAADDNAPAEKEKGRLKPVVILVTLAYGLMFMFYYPYLLNMSSILANEGLGTAAIAGTVISMYTVGGMIAGVLFGVVYPKIGKYTKIVFLAVQVIGLGIGYFSHNVPGLMIGGVLTGVAIYTLWPACITDFGKVLTPSGVTLASGIFTAGIGLGGFFASYYVGALTNITGNTNPRYPVFVGLIATLIIAVIWCIGVIGNKSTNTPKAEA